MCSEYVCMCVCVIRKNPIWGWNIIRIYIMIIYIPFTTDTLLLLFAYSVVAPNYVFPWRYLRSCDIRICKSFTHKIRQTYIVLYYCSIVYIICVLMRSKRNKIKSGMLLTAGLQEFVWMIPF